MGLSLQQLLAPSSEDDSLASLLTILNGIGFAASSWESGSIQLTLVRLLARLHSDGTQTVAAIARGRFNDLATGDWLTLKSSSDFSNDRIPAVAAQMSVLLSDPLGVGPFTIVLGQLVVTDPDGYTYRNVTAGTLAASGSVTLTFEAEVPGRDSLPREPLVFSTPIAGVTIAMVGSVPTRFGADAESDDKLRLRNSSRWATLAYGAPSAAYIHWSLTANALITRAYVDDLNPRGPGTLDIYIAGATGALGPSVATDVSNYIGGVTDGIVRSPIGADVHVLSATNAAVSIIGTLYYAASFDPSIVASAVDSAITDYFASIPVGGGGGKVMLSAIYRVITLVPGVVNVAITTPSGDVSIGSTQVPVAAISLTPVVA